MNSIPSGLQPDPPVVAGGETQQNGRSRFRFWKHPLRKKAVKARKGEGSSDPAQPGASEPSKTESSSRRTRTRARRDPNRLREAASPEQGRSSTPAFKDTVDERVLLVRQVGPDAQIAVVEDNTLVEYYDHSSTRSLIGNVYVCKVRKVMPSMEAAFVDIGEERDAIVYAGDLDWNSCMAADKPRRVENALTAGDLLVVQVIKDPVGHKGARATALVSLTSRYLIYCPQQNQGGVSKKLSSGERARLKQALKDAGIDSQHTIARTAAQYASVEDLKREAEELDATWEHLKQAHQQATGPTLIHQEAPAAVKIVRDRFTHSVHRLVIAGDDPDSLYRYIEQNAPSLKDRVEVWKEEQDLLDSWDVRRQVQEALNKKVALPSGGHIVIEHTEAMTVVDVNTGKFTGTGGALEETVTVTNIEAAKEVARQLRLRNIGGIVVVDFIDMDSQKNQDLVVSELRSAMAKDRTTHQVSEVTSLGLVQVTRKRKGASLADSHSSPCSACSGTGTVFTNQGNMQPNVRHRREKKPTPAAPAAPAAPSSLAPKRSGAPSLESPQSSTPATPATKANRRRRSKARRPTAA